MKIKLFGNIILVFLIILFFFIKFIIKSDTKKIYCKKKEIPSFKAAIFSKNEIVDSDKFFENDKFYLINIYSSWCVPCAAMSDTWATEREKYQELEPIIKTNKKMQNGL